MTTNYIQAIPGSTSPVLTLKTDVTGDLIIPTLQDVTVNNANNVYSWSQLNEGAQLQVPTNATNSISTNIVVEPESFFGDAAATTGSAAKAGLFGLSNGKTIVNFTINIGAKRLSGQGYVTGLAPAVSADAPVWVTPVTLTVSGDFTVA